MSDAPAAAPAAAGPSNIDDPLEREKWIEEAIENDPVLVRRRDIIKVLSNESTAKMARRRARGLGDGDVRPSKDAVLDVNHHHDPRDVVLPETRAHLVDVRKLSHDGVAVRLRGDRLRLQAALAERARPGDAILGMGARDPELPLFAKRLVAEWKTP